MSSSSPASSAEAPGEVSALPRSSYRVSRSHISSILEKVPLSGYAFAVISVLLAFVVRRLIDAWLGDQSPYTLFVVAVAVTGLFAGVRAAWLAVVLGAATAYFCFVPPRYQWGFRGISDAAAFGVYLLAAVAVVLLTHAHIRATRRAEQSLKNQIEAERKLLDAESLFRHFMDHSPACAYLRDEQGVVCMPTKLRDTNLELKSSMLQRT